ncbi:uncharacterized protein [Littorina saxatilis]|uniref:uncharacterized protein isoform X2 n=1 Tax=Littorina saxatilis TaxID=31220 RepID=UPI0038B4DE7E
MALHAKLLKHNILRVSKLKKLSHTTQAIERNFDRHAALSVTHTTCVAGDGKENAASKEDAGLWSRSAHVSSLSQLDTPPPTGQQSLSLALQELLALPPQTHASVGGASYTHSALCRSAWPSLDTLPSDKIQDREKSLTVMLGPPNYLPLVVKQVSYTTDDIIACPVDEDSQVDNSVTLYDSDVSLVSELQRAHWKSLLMDQSSLSTKDIDPSVAKVASLSKVNTRHFRRHSVCVSDPAGCGLDLTDFDMVLCDAQSPHSRSPLTVQCSAGPQQSAGPGGEGPNLDQLRAVEAYFIEIIPSFFKSRMDYQVYHPNIVLENNFWGQNEVAVGIKQYAMQMMKLRALTHLKFAHVHMEVVTSDCVEEEGAVRIEWRIVGISQLKALRFWKYTAWSYNKTFREDAEWIGGVSTLTVDKDGLVTIHRLDRVTPDEGQAAKQMSLTAKLALLLGLGSPKPSLSDFSSLLCGR